MKQEVIQILKSTCAAIIFALCYALIFTAIIQLFSLPAGAIKIVNQVFKIICIAGGGILFIKGDGGLVKGCIYGLTATIITYIIFALIAGDFTFTWKIIVELLLGSVAGGICGIIAVNVKK